MQSMYHTCFLQEPSTSTQEYRGDTNATEMHTKMYIFMFMVTFMLFFICSFGGIFFCERNVYLH